MREAASGRPLYRGRVDLSAGETRELSALIPRPLAFGAALEVGAFVLLSSRTRDRYVPAALAVRVRGALRNVPWTGAVVEARGSAFAGGGAAPGFDASLPYSFGGYGIDVGVGQTFTPASWLSVEPGVAAGAIWVWRRFDSVTYAATESLAGAALTGRVALGWAPSERLRVALRLEVGLLRASLGDSLGPHPFASGGADVELSF